MIHGLPTPWTTRNNTFTAFPPPWTTRNIAFTLPPNYSNYCVHKLINGRTKRQVDNTGSGGTKCTTKEVLSVKCGEITALHCTAAHITHAVSFHSVSLPLRHILLALLFLWPKLWKLAKKNYSSTSYATELAHTRTDAALARNCFCTNFNRQQKS